MAKKKTTKKFTPEEKRRSRKYRFLLGIFIVLNLAFFLTYDWLATFLVTSFLKIEYLYIYFDFSVPFVLFTVFFLLNFLFAAQLFESVGKGVSSFADFIAQKRHKNLILIICIFITSFCLLISFVCTLFCRVVADDTGVTESFLIKKDETLFTYDSADSVKIYVDAEYDSRLPTSYFVCVDVADGNEANIFYFRGFENDYKKVLDFLDNFEKEKIITDNTDMEDIITNSDEDQRLLEQIFNEYS